MKHEKWETETSRGLIGAFIFAAILLFAGSYFYLKNEEKVWSNQALKQLKNTSVLKARQVEIWRWERLADAREIGQSPLLQDAVSNWIGHQDKKRLKSEIQQRLQIVIQNNPDYVNILLTDTAGQALLAGKPGTPDLATTSTGKLVQEVVKTNNEIFGDLYKNNPGGAVYADIACPIRTDQHKIVGCILFRIDPNVRLCPILQAGSTDTTEESFLFEKSGDSVLYLTNLRNLPNSALSLKIPLTTYKNPAVRALKNGPGFYEGMGYHDKKVLEYIQPIKDSPWFLASKIDQNELYKPVYQRIKVIYAILVLLFLSVSAFLFLIINYRRKHFYRQLLEEEREQAALKSHYEYVVKYANDIILLEDENLNIIEANQRAQQAYQYSLAELRKMKITDLAAPESKPLVEALLKNINENDGAIIEAVHRRKDGSHFHVEISARMIKVDGQDFLHQVIRDITERKLAEMALIESEERFRTTLYSTGDAIITTEIDGKVRYMNPVAEELTGWIESEASGKPIREVFQIFNEDTREEVENPVDKVLDKGMIVMLSNHTFLKSRSGIEIPIGDSGAPIRNAEGKITGVVLVFRDQTKDRLSQKELEESELHFHSLSDNAPVGIFRTDSDGFTTYVNPKWRLLAGLTEEEAMGNGWLTAVHPDDREMLSNGWKIASQNKEVSNAEYRFLHPDGTIVYVMGHTVPEKNSENKITGYVGTITDITERKKAENQLALFRTLIDGSNDAFEIVDPETGRFLDVNERGRRDLGYTREEMLALTVFDIDPRVDKPTFTKIQDELLKSDNGIWEGIHLRKDGTTFPVEVNIIIVELDRKYMVSVARDISSRKKAEDELRASEEKFRSVFENSVIGIYRTTPDGKIVMANHALLEMLGYESFDEFSNKDLNSEGYEPNYLRSNFKMLIERDGIIENLESAWSCKDGSTIFLSEFARLVRDENNNPTFYDGMVLDITERKKMFDELSVAKEKAEESDRLKSAFLAVMSHELRTPLNAVIGFSSLIDEEMPMDQITSFAQMINNSGNNLLEIVEGILDLTVLESGEAKPKPEIFELCNLMDHLFELLKEEQRKADNRQVEVERVKHIDDETLSIFADKQRITKVFANLFRNALKFTHSGKIEFGYELEPERKTNQIKFFVKDTGIGIQENQKDLIFEKFRQVEDSYTRKYGGTGIGLAICSKTVEMLGGQIGIDSEPGKGSTFYFTIPIVELQQTIQPEPSHDTTENEKKLFSSQTILIAEDDDLNFKYLDHLLKQTNLKVLRARDGQEALILSLNHPNISLVLMDIKMPNTNGYEATKKIKAANPRLPVIAVTAYAMTGDRENALSEGCDEYLEKPIKRDKLFALIRKFMSLR